MIRVLPSKTFASYPQTIKKNSITTKSAGTAFLTATDTFKELKNFDWKIVKEMFQENDKHQERTEAKPYKINC